MSELIQGKWDDLVTRHDLHGRMVQIIVLDDDQLPAQTPDDGTWLQSLKNWADGHERLGHPVDDSRESIYSGTADDSR